MGKCKCVPAGECGTSVAAQWAIRAELRATFAEKPWVDVFTKQDLLQPVRRAAGARKDILGCEGVSAPGDAPGQTCSSAGSDDARERRSTHAAAGTSAAGAGGAEEVFSGAAADSADMRHGGGPVMSRHAEPVSVELEPAQVDAQRGAVGRSFSWNGRTEGGLQTALEVAQALPEAAWVSSVTQEGMLDLKAAVLHMLQKQQPPQGGERTESSSLQVT